MTDRDVLLVRVHDRHGAEGAGGGPDADADDVWELRAAGKPRRTLGPFTAALDVALEWAAELGGKIYRQHEPASEPELYNPTG
jgi:hypothetical protein